MILSLKNIGKIESAKVELNGITVIAGENDTGKSTVGKTLYSVFNGFYKVESKIQKEREENIERILDILYHDVTNRLTMRVDTGEISRIIVESTSKYSSSPALLRTDVLDAISQVDHNFTQKACDFDQEKLDEAFNRIKEILGISDTIVFASVLTKKLDAEFGGQVNNIFAEEPSEISLQIKGNNISIKIEDNSVKSISNKMHLNTEVLYIDDPFILDEIGTLNFWGRLGYPDHKEHLLLKLLGKDGDSGIISQIIISNKLDRIYSKINSICDGEIVRNKRRSYGYKPKGSDKVLHSKNISSGLKTFVILKTLLQNGALEENGAIVLDEPEVHLHPEWQLLLAELIVLIQKEFNMHILVNTHSPYFLNAIEVYAAKYQLADKCKYYKATSFGNVSKIEDVSDNVDIIYQRLAQPLQTLENERWSGNA